MTTIEPDKMVDFGQLIAQPLLATMQAEIESAKNFVAFFKEYGLEESNEGETGGKKTGFKMLTFSYTQQNPTTGKLDEYVVQVPLLSLIPLPLLQIDSAEFDFDIRLFTQVEYQNNPRGERGWTREGEEKEEGEGKEEIGKFQGFQARLSPTGGRAEEGKSAQTLDANMKVKIKMKQADLPIGMIKMMTVFEQSTAVMQEKKIE